MKIKIIYIVAFSTVMLALSSCKKTFFTDVNVNPNAPTSVTPGPLLSTVEGALAYTQGGDMSRFSQYFTQQTFGAFNQSLAYYNYVITSQDVDQLWGNLYTSVMENIDTMMVISDANGFNRYSGVSRILMAYTLQITVDCWGNIPYSNAFKGLSLQLSSTYDSASALYPKIAALAHSGIARLQNSSAGRLTPGAEDVIYGGSASSWIKFAHAIKARIYLHQSKNNAAMAAKALTEITSAFTTNADIAQYVFGDASTANNPVFQFNDQRGYTDYAASTLSSTMIGLADPRYPMFFDSAYADYEQEGIGTYYGNPTSPVEFISFDELLFAKAEATLRNGGTVATAQKIYDSAITMNMLKVGVAPADITTYLAANGTLSTTVTTAIGQIASQAYIALYLNPEAWTTWRRTGFPALTPVVGSAIPRRLLYPLSETNYNQLIPHHQLYIPLKFSGIIDKFRI